MPHHRAGPGHSSASPRACLGRSGIFLLTRIYRMKSGHPGLRSSMRSTGTSYHIGIVAGMAAVFCRLIFTAGWRRWNTGNAPDSIAGEMISLALVASAGAMLLGYGFKGSLAVYLPGGIDGEPYPNENLLSVFMFNDFAPYIAWYGVAMAAIGVAWFALREHRLPVWHGIVAAVFAVVPIAFLVATGLPGFPGVVDPFWMIIFGIGLAVRLRRSASQPASLPAQQVVTTAL